MILCTQFCQPLINIDRWDLCCGNPKRIIKDCFQVNAFFMQHPKQVAWAVSVLVENAISAGSVASKESTSGLVRAAQVWGHFSYEQHKHVLADWLNALVHCSELQLSIMTASSLECLSTALARFHMRPPVSWLQHHASRAVQVIGLKFCFLSDKHFCISHLTQYFGIT